MTSEHASDEQLQLFAINSMACRPAIRAHISTCADCQAKAAEYKQLMAAIEVQPLPTLDFDVSGLVLERLETKGSNWWIYVAVAAAVLPIAIGIYYFRMQLFGGTSVFFVSLLAITAVCIVIATMIDQVKTYRRKMNMLATK